MEQATNVSTTTISAPFALPYWIASVAILGTITLSSWYIFRRVYLYGHPYCVLNMGAKNGRTYYRLCLITTFFLMLTLVGADIFPLLSWNSDTACYVLTRVIAYIYSMSVLFVLISYLLQEENVGKHPSVYSGTAPPHIKAYRLLVGLLVMSLFPHLYFALHVLHFNESLIHATPAGCLTFQHNPTWIILLCFHRFVLLLCLFGQYIPTYQKLKQLQDEKQLKLKEITHNTALKNQSHTIETELQRMDELISRIQKICKLSLFIIVNDVAVNFCFLLSEYLQLCIMLMCVQLFIHLICMIVFLDRWAEVFFPVKQRLTLADLQKKASVEKNAVQEDPKPSKIPDKLEVPDKPNIIHHTVIATPVYVSLSQLTFTTPIRSRTPRSDYLGLNL